MTVKVCDTLPAGNYLWTKPLEAVPQQVADDPSQPPTENDHTTAQLFDVVVERIRYKDSKDLLSKATEERFAPLAELSVRFAKLDFSKVSRRILLIEGSDAHRAKYSGLDVHLKKLQQVDPSLHLEYCESPKESVKFLKTIHAELSQQVQNESASSVVPPRTFQALRILYAASALSSEFEKQKIYKGLLKQP